MIPAVGQKTGVIVRLSGRDVFMVKVIEPDIMVVRTQFDRVVQRLLKPEIFDLHIIRTQRDVVGDGSSGDDRGVSVIADQRDPTRYGSGFRHREGGITTGTNMDRIPGS